MRHRIALGIGWHLGCNRGVLRGIETYARQQDWETHLQPFEPSLRDHVRKWQPHGLIIDAERSGAAARVLRGLRRPVVSVLSIWNTPWLPRITLDDDAVGRVAAEYLLDRGFRHFAFCGEDYEPWTPPRRRGFADVIERAGHACHVISPTNALQRRGRPVTARTVDAYIAEALSGLARPIGILAENDVAGQMVTRACRQIGLHVPDGAAVIGVDNDDVFCNLSRPSLSSVDVPWEVIGFEAARLLDRLLHGQPPPARPVLIPPTGVVTRGSTDVLAVTDPAVAGALRFIRDKAPTIVGVEDVARHAGVSRRVLERRFQQALSSTPLKEIRAARLHLARQLLVRSDLSLQNIAERCGFRSAQQFSVTFRQLNGIKAIDYRKQFRLR